MFHFIALSKLDLHIKLSAGVKNIIPEVFQLDQLAKSISLRTPHSAGQRHSSSASRQEQVLMEFSMYQVAYKVLTLNAVPHP